ncbi:glycosyltransferase family 4 protein [Haloterrigena salifodinae]|uniref:Glycosyltransferase family 4 protein n=1 Tax=Haloterrigena salifodinae TaxID=2675099 RepID=A0A8T8E1Z9_9EURY|nr:glycosyltransferase family 1 protein [Haloterrigena salifodinae]QRV15789.1 glycosyltransferase family 4 protein [Haloterrigena salifodinae]
MKIGINARTFSVSEPGGAVQASKRLTTELVSNTDHEVVLFGAPSLASDFDAEVHSTGFYDRQLWGVLWERLILPRLIRKSDVDVLYCPNGNAPSTEIDTPVVMCIHDVNAQKGWSGGVHGVYRKLTVPAGAEKADAVVTVSEFSKREIVETLDIPKQKVKVIYNGINEVFFQEDSEPFDLPDRYLLFVGSLNPRKNIEGVISAYREIRSELDVELVFIGPENKNIFQSLDMESVEGIHRCGYLDILEVKYAYENAEALVFPSFYEGFGLPPLESLACGTPVVASDRGSLPEVLGDAAVFVNPESTSDIARGIRDVVLGAEITEEQMRQQAMNYTWGSVSQRVMMVFDSVL